MEIITMKDFLNNPTGKGSASFARRDMVKENLLQRYTKLLSDTNNGINMKCYNDKGSYIFHFKMPSETYGNQLKYDVVLQFIPIGNVTKDDVTIVNYSMKMYSNSPQFMFTYAYVFNKAKLIPKELLSKLSKESLRKEPNIRNPFHTYGFEKSIYFCLLFIKRSGYDRKSVLQKESTKLKSFKDQITKNVNHSEITLGENRRLRKLADEKKREQKKTTRISQSNKAIQERDKRSNKSLDKRISKPKSVKKDRLKEKKRAVTSTNKNSKSAKRNNKREKRINPVTSTFKRK